MNLNLHNVRIIDRASSFHQSLADIQISEGKIQKIKKSDGTGQGIDLKGMTMTPGWMDLSSSFCDPGMEHKETIASGLNAALRGGFSDVCVMPNTIPYIDSKSGIEYLLSRAAQHVVRLRPIGGLSVKGDGEHLAELLDLHHAGAVAFSDGTHPIHNSELLLKALQYTAAFDGLVINRPMDVHLSKYGQMHEGIQSTLLGMKGIPAVAESIMVERDLSLLGYAGGRIHFGSISTHEAIDKIRNAKKQGLRVTCDVPIHNLVFTDQDLGGFDPNFKLMPPLRTESDRQALIEGLKDGTIDAITSDHQPQDTENKNLEFDLSTAGAISLQTVFSQLVSLGSELPFDLAVEKLTSGPRRILGLDPVTIEEGNDAVLSIFDLDSIWKLDRDSNASLSHNTPLFGSDLRGQCMGVINGRHYHLDKKLIS
ncbi:MAG: dihydroorotase [Cyclobacteriaceae bacterium]|nr:dihydroorotase [Cyclobacteriaceae bacterium]